VAPDIAGTENHRVPALGGGYSAKQHAATTLWSVQQRNPDVHRQTPGNLTHRGQHRQLAVHLNGLKGDGCESLFLQQQRKIRVGGKMQKTEQDVIAAQQPILGGDRLLRTNCVSA
jgi:hypothetical protein